MDEEEKRLDVIREVHRLNAIKEAEKVYLTLHLNFWVIEFFSLVLLRNKAKLKNLKVGFAPKEGLARKFRILSCILN